MIKHLVEATKKIPYDNQKLIFRGSVLEDEKTVGEYGIANDDSIHIIRLQ